MPKDRDTSPLYDFMAGVDPTGIYTVRGGRRNKEHHAAHKAIGAVGGFLGGAAVIPSTISMITSGLPKYIAAGKKGKLSMLGEAAIAPYRKLHTAIKANKELSLLGTKDRIGTKNIREVMNDVPIGEYKRIIKGITHKGSGGVKGVKKNIRRSVANGIYGGAGVIGLSGAINSGSSIAQYNTGMKSKDRVSERAKTAAINYGISIERDMLKKADGYGALDFLAGAAVGGGLGATAGELTERHVKKKIINALQGAIDKISRKKIGKGAYLVGVPMALMGGSYAAHKGNSRRRELRMRRSYNG